MDVKDLLKLIENPEQAKQIVASIETQREALAKEMKAYGAAKDAHKDREEAAKALKEAEAKADSIVKDGEAQARRIVEEAKVEAEKVAKQKKDVGLKIDAIIAHEAAVVAREKAISAKEAELAYSLKAAKDEQAELQKRNKELEEKLVKLRGLL